MKKIIAILLVTLLGVGCFAACSNKDTSDGDTSDTATESVSDTENEGNEDESTDDSNDDNNEDDKRLTSKTFVITSATDGVKVLGVRNLASENSLHLDWSCSGVEFGIKLNGGNVKFNFSVTKPCLFRIWIDGQEYKEDGSALIEVDNLGVMMLTDIPEGEHTIRIVKVTGFTLSNVELKSVVFAGELLTDREAKDKDLYIEFIGDSITCGYGVLGKPNDGTYKAQDGTLAYSYLLAEALDADYSMFALSGHRLVEHVIKKDSAGDISESAYLKTNHLKSTENYDFARKADIVVINIGTNVFDQNKGADTFEDYYYTLLKTVKEKNGEACKILCLYNAMNENYESAILSAVERFGGADRAVVTYKLDCAGAHPTIAQHAAYAEVLKPVIENLPEPFDPILNVIPEGNGDEENMDWNTFGNS